MKGWMCVKDTNVLAYRFEPNYESQLKEGKKDLNLLGKGIAAIPEYAEKSLGCSLGALTYMGQVNLTNPHLFDLPPSSQMTPLGSGTSYRFGEALKEHHAVGVTIERVLLKNDDVLNLDDILATQLTKEFIIENAGEIGRPSFDLPAALQATMRGNFHLMFEKALKEERRGTAHYHVDPLLLYGHYHLIGEKRHLTGSPYGYDLKFALDSGKSIFTQFSPVKTDSQAAFFEVVSAVEKLHRDFYLDRVNVSLSNLSMLSLLRRTGENFLLVDYTDPSPRAPTNYDHFGVLLKVTRDGKGSSMGKVIYHLNVVLSAYLDKLRQGSSIGEFLSIGNKLRAL